MFDYVIRELKKMEGGSQLPISIPIDKYSYFDRRCPSDGMSGEL